MSKELTKQEKVLEKTKKGSRYELNWILATDENLRSISSIFRINGVEIRFTKNMNSSEPNMIIDTYDHKKNALEEYLNLIDESMRIPGVEYVYFIKCIGQRIDNEPYVTGRFSVLLKKRKNRNNDVFDPYIDVSTSNYDQSDYKQSEKKLQQLLLDTFNSLDIFEKYRLHIIRAVESGDVSDFTELIQVFSDKVRVRIFEFMQFVLLTDDTKNRIDHPGEQKSILSLDPTSQINSPFFGDILSIRTKEFEGTGEVQRTVKYSAASRKTTGNLRIKAPVNIDKKSVLLLTDDENFERAIEASGADFEYYDFKIFKAVCALVEDFLQKNPELDRSKPFKLPITSKDIHFAMGYMSRNVSKKETEKIKISMLKLASTKISFNWEKERAIREIGIDRLEKAKEEYGEPAVMGATDYLINAKQWPVKPSNSKKITNDSWMILSIPPLYIHAKITGTIFSVPREWFDIECLKMSDRRNSLIQGITERISRAHYFMRHYGKKQANSLDYNKIVYDRFIAECGIKIKKPKDKTQNIDDIEAIFKEFKSRGIVEDYKFESKRGKARYALKFFV